MTESNVLVKRQRERELKQHQDRILNMRPCIDTKPGIVRQSLSPVTKRPARVRIDKGKLRQIEQQNHRLLMRLRYIHKHYSLYMPRKSVYLQRGEAGRWVKILSILH
ncbi:hypothetical protein KC19_5G123700 [Ceratodon purpureus]|uniref:Uncharacterized protein n=1 Tax=Ceratodon purpureus TaxID=3225 RepID=A0A8T0I359_CERPU|nr:hypothetical protein KC19_5G123700 [Ceratodon purpureus]